MAHATDVERLRAALGVAHGTRVVAWMATVYDYFRDALGVNPLDATDLAYLRGIDFHRPATVEPLRADQLLVRFPEIIGGVVQLERPKPYRFFATPGATPAHLGWNPDETPDSSSSSCHRRSTRWCRSPARSASAIPGAGSAAISR